MASKRLGSFLKAAYCAGIAVMTVLFSMRDSRSNLIRETVIEAGSPITVESFFRKAPEEASFITDLSSIDTSVPSVYKLILHYDLVFTETVTLHIEDTVAPKADGVTRMIRSYEDIPQASEMVENAYDLSGISSIEYVNEPDISNGGIIYTPIRLTDSYGNSSTVQARFVVTTDTTPPVIFGVSDSTMEQGQSPDLTAGVYATDNISKIVPVRVDASKLDITRPGTYEITYIAKDDAGNEATAKSYVTVTKKAAAKKPAGKKKAKKSSGSYKNVDAIAAKLAKQLKRGSNVETARAIFKWVHKNIHYVHNASKLTGKRAAYQGLTKRTGNCRVYAYTCQILLNKAGIRNMIVSRYPVTTRHFWNLVYMDGGWYHCDATPFRDHPKLYFKLTDAQLDYHHRFKKNKYPARATK